MKKIYAELARIQQELNAPKNLYNKFGQYYYRNAEGILAAVKPLLGGLALVISDEPVMVGERYYIRATAMLTDGEESVAAVAYAREDETKKGMDGCQLTGACSSYARKYALNALLMIDDTKDSDDDSLSPKNPENEAPRPKPQSRPENGTVTTAGRLPQAKAEAAKNGPEGPKPAAGETPGAYVKRRIAEIKSMVRDFNFLEVRAELIKGGVIEDVPSATMDMDQAVALMNAIEANVQKAAS